MDIKILYLFFLLILLCSCINDKKDKNEVASINLIASKESILGNNVDEVKFIYNAFDKNGDIVKDADCKIFLDGDIYEKDSFKTNSPGLYKFFVACKGIKSKEFDLEVKEIILERLEIVHKAKLEYGLNEELDISTLVVRGYYSDGTYKIEDIDSSNITGFDTSRTGYFRITIKIGEISTYYYIDISTYSNAEKSFEIVKLPYKRFYKPEESIDLTGIKVLKKYGDEISEMNPEDLSGWKNYSEEKMSLIVSYFDEDLIYYFHSEFDIEEGNYELESLELIKEPNKKEYYIGEELDVTGIELKGYYSNGDERIEDVNEKWVYGFDSSSPGEKELYINYNGIIVYYKIEVLDVELERVEELEGNKKLYYQGDEFDPTGINLKLIYSNGDSKIKNIGLDKIKNFNSLQLGENQLEIDIDGTIFYYSIEVIKDEMERIEIEKPAEKTVYYKKDWLNIGGLVIKSYYKSGLTFIEEINSKNIEGFNSETSGKKILTVRVNGKTTEYEIEVLDSYSFDYAGKNYRAKEDNGTRDPFIRESNFIVYEPETRDFNADGFFYIKGFNYGKDDFKYVYVIVKKNSTGEESYYYLEGNFDKRIWLRYGAGDYTVTLHKMQLQKENTINSSYDGDIGEFIYWDSSYVFNVNNTRDEDGRFIYPSNDIQSDNEIIKYLAEIIIEDSGRTGNYNTILAFHNYIVKNIDYDYDSLADGKRKKQDALSTYKNEVGVCEGYTSLFNALLRSQGIECKAVLGEYNGGLHAWTSVLRLGDWFMVDVMIDDAKTTGWKPDCSYFLLADETGIDNDHIIIGDRPERSIR